jgi:predicted transcriptional regulator of viral defense system
MRFSGSALTAGVEEHVVDGVPVKVYSAAKTIADCFKYRNKIGVDIALAALRDCRRRRKCTDGKIRRYARVCRVAKVIKPYMEATS